MEGDVNGTTHRAGKIMFSELWTVSRFACFALAAPDWIYGVFITLINEQTPSAAFEYRTVQGCRRFTRQKLTKNTLHCAQKFLVVHDKTQGERCLNGRIRTRDVLMKLDNMHRMFAKKKVWHFDEMA